MLRLPNRLPRYRAAANALPRLAHVLDADPLSMGLLQDHDLRGHRERLHTERNDALDLDGMTLDAEALHGHGGTVRLHGELLDLRHSEGLDRYGLRADAERIARIRGHGAS